MATSQVVQEQQNQVVEEVDELDSIFNPAEKVETGEEAPVVEGAAEVEGEEAEGEVTEQQSLFDPAEENRELKQILRDQKRQMLVMKSKLERLEKRYQQPQTPEKEEDSLEDIFGEKPAAKPKAPQADESSPVEEISEQLVVIQQQKGPVLDSMVELLAMTPQYADIADVCSQGNFDDIFEAVGKSIADKEGKDATLAALETELAVWKMANPYKYMYGIIKKFHPKYATVESAKPAAAAASPTGVKKGKVAVKAPGSIANIPGAQEAKSEWTLARIEGLDELELTKVPADIWDKYQMGLLK